EKQRRCARLSELRRCRPQIREHHAAWAGRQSRRGGCKDHRRTDGWLDQEQRSVRRFRLLQPIHFGLFLWLFGRKSAAPSPRSLAIGDDNAASFSSRIVVVGSLATVSPQRLHTNGIELAPGVWHIPPVN